MSTVMEKTYYQSGNVLITSTRAEMGGKTFVMSNITSVSLAEIPPNTGCATWLLLGGVIVAIMGFGIASSASLTLVGVICAAVGFFWLRSLKTQYAVNLSSASGETRVMQSTDRNHIEDIVNAIKQVVIDSGVQKVEAVSIDVKVCF